MIGSAAGVGAVCAVEAAMRAQTNGATMVNGAKDAKRALAELEALRPGTKLAKGAFEVVSTRRVAPYDVVAVELDHVKT